MSSRCPVCDAVLAREAGQNGRPPIYCSEEHRKEAELERDRLRSLLAHLGKRRIAAIEAHAMNPHERRQAVIDALDAELAEAKAELVRLSTAGGVTPTPPHTSDE